MNPQSVRDKAVSCHLELLQGMASLVSPLESIQNKAKDFLIDFGLDRIWEECFAVQSFIFPNV